MKRVCLMMIAMLMSWTVTQADEQITVSASSRDIADNLDLKVVAKLFAEAKNLEEFESMLNNPDSAFSNLDLNGDGVIDYLRVIETGEGNKKLIVLQAILAKDIYQDVASIYVEKDETTGQVKVQVIGEEQVYGRQVVIEPVYIYRPVIYDWFWGPYWTAWYSPYYWGTWPGYWYRRPIVAVHVYHHHCRDYCSRRVTCSYRNTREVSPHARALRDVAPVSGRSIHSTANTSAVSAGVTNSRTATAGTRSIRRDEVARTSAATTATSATSQTTHSMDRNARTFGSSNLANRNSIRRDGSGLGSSTAVSRNVGSSTASGSTVSRATGTTTAAASTTRSSTTTTVRNRDMQSASSARNSNSISRSSSASSSRYTLNGDARQSSGSFSQPTRSSSSSFGASRVSGSGYGGSHNMGSSAGFGGSGGGYRGGGGGAANSHSIRR